MDLRQIKTGPADFGMMTYDPAFTNTAACRSAITYIDGDQGILRYRGYPIEELAEHCTYLEVAYLLLWGELPTEPQLADWEREVMRETVVHESTRTLIASFARDAHPMAMLQAAVASLAALHPESRQVHDPSVRREQIVRLIAAVPTIAACGRRHCENLPFVPPRADLGFTANFMQMLWKDTGTKFAGDPVLARALDILFILHADHEQNCSTSAMRAVGSSHADPYASTAAAMAALSGPLHGGANEQVIRMLDEIGTKENVKTYVEKVKAGQFRLMGFGHRVYKNYDPRAKLIKRTAEQVFRQTGRNPKIDIAIELERIALEDSYFVQRKLYPNVDFYSGIIYEAMGFFRPEAFTVLFAIARTVGWLAQWQEMLEDSEQKIARPRQVYTGQDIRHYVPMEQRTPSPAAV
jgi:citrate synthase